MPSTVKLEWHGTITSVQPRIQLTRSFDQRSHTYQGYLLGVHGTCGGSHGEFCVALGKAAYARHRFQPGDLVVGQGVPVANPRIEIAGAYKVSRLVLEGRPATETQQPPPWHGPLPELPIYRERGHRRLATRTYNASCTTCLWGCRMPVEMIIDHWNPSQRDYRTETFCYGPLSCPVYKPGPNRRVPGRRGMVYIEEDWVDEQDVEHRDPDE